MSQTKDDMSTGQGFDGAGAPLRRGGLCRNDVMGLFVHLIDARPIDNPDAAHKRYERRNE